MTGENEGRCQALLFIADDHGDNSATIKCQKVEGHLDEHIERFEREGGWVTILWPKDERRRCDHCPCWDHEHDWDNCPLGSAEHDYDTCETCQGALAK